MSSSLARRYRGASLAAAAVAVVTSGALAVAATTTAPTPSADPTTVAPSTGGSAGPKSSETPGGPSVRPVVDDEPTVLVDTATVTDEVAGDMLGIGRLRTVEVDTDALPGASGGQLELPLFDDTTVVADLAAPVFRSAGGYRTWGGTIDGVEGSSVVLVEQDGVLSGLVNSVHTTYRLRPGPDGSTRIEQMDESQFPTAVAHATPPADGSFVPTVSVSHEHTHAPGTPEHTHDAADTTHEHTHAPGTPAHDHGVPPAAPSGDAAGAPAGDPAGGTAAGEPETSAATADAPVVDVLIAYTSAAKARMGGQGGMDADIALMIEQTNRAFDTSGINAALRLVHSVEVAQNGPVDATTLNRLTNPGDGVYDNVHVLRDQYGADLVALIADGAGGAYCGLAWQMNTISTSFAPYAMSVTDAGCATGNTTFTHELGHNFGAAHDRGAWSGTPVLPYGYDWVNPTQRWRTVMSYANACSGCGRLLRFSNPDQTYNGAPLGAPIGASNAADNRAVLNTTSSTVASMRGAPAPASLTLAAPTADQQVTASTKLVATWSTTGYMGPDATVELLRGSTLVRVLHAKAPLGTGRFEYLVPLTTVRATDYRLRITPNLSPAHVATSDAFAVVDPVITPAYSPGAAAGAVTRVNWTYTGVPGGTVKVELIKDDKALAVLKPGAVLGTGGSGGVDVLLPAALNNGGGYQFRTTLSAVPKAPRLTGTFSVSSSRELVVTAPNGTATATAGAPMTVTWTASGVLGTSLKAELVKGDLVVFSSPLVPVANRTMTFTPPARLPSGTDYRLRLVAASYPTVLATSDGRFPLDGTSLTVTSQGSAGPVTAGRPLAITWTTVGVPGTAVKLEAVSPTSPTVVVVASTPLAAGTYTWNVPVNLARADWTIRATVVGNTLVSDTSAAATTVVWPTVSLSAPAAAVAGTPVTVSWAFSDGASAPVRVRLVQGTRAVVTLTTAGRTAADGTGSLTYTLPITLPPGDHQFEVSAAANAAIVGRSGTVPLTRPTVSATAPVSGVAGAPVTVSWAFTDGAVPPVRVRLMQGTRAVATVTTAGRTNPDGTGSSVYRLPITLAPGGYQFEVAAAANVLITRTTGGVSVTRPTLAASGATSVARGQTATISWAFSGGAAVPVRIDLVQGTKVVLVRSGAATLDDGTGSFVYRAPTTLLPGTYTLRIRPALLAATDVVEATRTFTVS